MAKHVRQLPHALVALVAGKFHNLLEVVTQTAVSGGHCYTQFTDTFQEANGLLTADRVPEIPIEKIAAATGISRTYISGGVQVRLP